jgi:hypothetical protein
MKNPLVFLLPPIMLLALLAVLSVTPPRAAAEFPAAELSTEIVFYCQEDGSVSAGFGWQSSLQGYQWFDVSLHDDGFASSFLTLGPLPPAQNGLRWDGLSPATWYYVRVHTLTSAGWFASPTMHFYTPDDCGFSFVPGEPAYTSAECPGLSSGRLSGCLWTSRPDYDTYGIGETVTYCYYVSEPTDLRIVARKPDGTSLVVLDGFVNASGACLGPFRAARPFGLRTVRMFGSGDLLDETHFYVR